MCPVRPTMAGWAPTLLVSSQWSPAGLVPRPVSGFSSTRFILTFDGRHGDISVDPADASEHRDGIKPLSILTVLFNHHYFTRRFSFFFRSHFSAFSVISHCSVVSLKFRDHLKWWTGLTTPPPLPPCRIKKITKSLQLRASPVTFPSCRQW